MIINVFTIGDSTRVSTWSNIPYFFCKYLEKNNIEVNRINIEPVKGIEKVFNFSILKIIKLFSKIFGKTTTYNYSRSRLNYFITGIKIKGKCIKYSSATYNLFLTYSFSSIRYSPIPVIHLCDFTFIYQISYLENRRPDIFERYAVQQEYLNLQSAKLVISLFPMMSEIIRKDFNIINTQYIGNVLNIPDPYFCNQLPLEKINSNAIVFIGRRRYLEGLKILIEALDILLIDFDQSYDLHIIGLNRSDLCFEISNPNLYFYGYLDKSVPDACKLYYKIINQTKLYINPTWKWAGFSSSLEAMYYFTPIIVPPYKEFLATFGEEVNFGFYINDQNSKSLALLILKLMRDRSLWNEFSRNAHLAVSQFTWDNYIQQFISLLD
jgi:glycosyltransferase involved in cell wall biosynthesis